MDGWRRTRSRLLAALPAVMASTWLAGCSEGPLPASTVPGRWYTTEQIETGRAVFRQNCAGCHGLDAQGTADWRQRDEAGNLPPPPLNGSAHAWHHSREQLRDYILEGGVPLGGSMPGFAAVLDERDALATIAYFQSTWDEEIYARWVSMYPPDAGDAS